MMLIPDHDEDMPRKVRPLADINVTPMVDVMLVLLIIFMVAAPLLTVAVPVDLPQADAPSANDDKPPLNITLAKDGRLFLMTDTNPVALPDAIARLKAMTAQRPNDPIFLSGDKEVPYGQVMELMRQMGEAGFPKLMLSATPAQGGK